MTDKKGKFWNHSPGRYLQPDVHEPPLGQNPDNARHAIWHLGREIEIEFYPESHWRVGCDDDIDDLRNDRGEPVVVMVWAVIQPYTTQDSAYFTRQTPYGEFSEGRQIIHIDSHHEYNLEAAKAANEEAVSNGRSEIFPSGFIRIIEPSEEVAGSPERHAQIIRWKGRRWKALRGGDFYEAGNEDLHGDEGAVFRFICSKFEDRDHERLATPEIADEAGEKNFWGPSRQ